MFANYCFIQFSSVKLLLVVRSVYSVKSMFDNKFAFWASTNHMYIAVNSLMIWMLIWKSREKILEIDVYNSIFLESKINQTLRCWYMNLNISWFRCTYGYKCRFLKAHVDKDNKLVVNEAKVAENPVFTVNGISGDVQTKLLKGRVRN